MILFKMNTKKWPKNFDNSLKPLIPWGRCSLLLSDTCSENAIPFKKSIQTLISTTEIKCQLNQIKQITADIKTLLDSEGESVILSVLDVLISIYLGIQAKHPAKHVITSCLQSMPASVHGKITQSLCCQLEYNILNTDAASVPTGELRRYVDAVNGLLDNFALGELCVKQKCIQVLSFLSRTLEAFTKAYSPTLPPVEHNEAMHHCHVTLQATTKILQKCATDIERVQSREIQNGPFTALVSKFILCARSILAHDNFLMDCRSTCGMCLGQIIKFLNKHSLVHILLKCVFSKYNEQSTTEVPDWLISSEGGSFSEHDLTLTSYLCVCHGLVAVLHEDDLIWEYSPGHCLLVDVMLEELMNMASTCVDTAQKLLVGRSVLVWTARACSVVGRLSDAPAPRERFVGTGPVVQRILSYVWTSWEDPIDALRLSARQIFDNTVKLHLAASQCDALDDPFLQALVTSLCSTSWSTKGKYGPLISLVNQMGANQIIALHPGIAGDILGAFREQALSCYASELFERLCRCHLYEVRTGSGSLESWDTCWVDPVLDVMCGSNKTQKSNVLEYVLPRLLKVNQDSLNHMISALSGEHGPLKGSNKLGALIMCLRKARALGMLPPKSADNSNAGMFAIVGEDKLKQALSSADEQVRLDAFALLCENNKTSEAVMEEELRLVRFFLQSDLNNQSAYFRQAMLSFMKKLFLRINESGSAMLKQMLKDENESKSLLSYKVFCQWLLGELFDGLFPGATFARRSSCLHLLSLLLAILGLGRTANNATGTDGYLLSLDDVITTSHIQTLIECLADTFEENKIEAFNILTSLPEYLVIGMQSEGWLDEVLQTALTLSVSTKPQDCTTAAYLFRLLMRQHSALDLISRSLTAKSAKSDIPLDVTSTDTDQCSVDNTVQPAVHDGSEQKLKMSKMVIPENDLNRRSYLLVKLLLCELKEQLNVARVSLLHVAATKPMYPTIHCICYILTYTDLRSTENQEEWRVLMSELICCCCSVAEVVSPVVHNSSPEGNIPVEAIKGPGLLMLATEESSKTVALMLAAEESHNTVAMMPEYLVVCCWRSIKEVSLVLGELVLHCPITDPDKADNAGIITYQQILSIGDYFITQLVKAKHRGAFELAYAGFVKMCEMLWNDPIDVLRELPKQWLDHVMKDIQSVEANSRMCATRRSAGVPFYVQAMVVTEPVSLGRSSFKSTMTTLLELALDDGQTAVSASQVHSLNILRALYRDTRLGKDVTPYICDGMKAAITGFASSDWAVRNSATLLFSALMTRIFGVKRNKDESALSKKNCLTGRIFFQRYSILYQFLLTQLEEATQNIAESGKLELHPGLYPTLMVLGRLVPSVMEGSDTSLNMAAFIPHVVRCAASPVFKTRLMAARALQPLVFKDQLTSVLTDLLNVLPTQPDGTLTQNHLHGLLLQIKQLLCPLEHLQTSVLRLTGLAVLPGLCDRLWLMTRSCPCLVVRKEALETVACVLRIPWPLDDITIEASIDTLRQAVSDQVSGELADTNSHYPYAPGLTEFQETVVSIFVNYMPAVMTEHVDNAVRNSLLRQREILNLLKSHSYEVRIIALNYIQRMLILYSDCAEMTGKVCREPGIEACLSQEVVERLVHMAFGGESWSPCLVKVFQVLAIHPALGDHWLYNSYTDEQHGNLKMMADVLSVAKETARDELKKSVLLFSGVVVPFMCHVDHIAPRVVTINRRLARAAITSSPHMLSLSGQIYTRQSLAGLRGLGVAIFERAAPEEKPVHAAPIGIAAGLLRSWVDFLRDCSTTEQSDDLKVAVATVLKKNANRCLLSYSAELLGDLTMTVWEIILDLHQEDDLEVKAIAASILPALDHTVTPVHSLLALDLLVSKMVELEAKRNATGCLQLLVRLMTREDNSDNEEEAKERLFDKGEMNTYREDIATTHLLAKHVISLQYLPAPMSCMREVQDFLDQCKAPSTYGMNELKTMDHLVEKPYSLLVDQWESPSAADEGIIDVCMNNEVVRLIHFVFDDLVCRLETILATDSCVYTFAAAFVDTVGYQKTVSQVYRILMTLYTLSANTQISVTALNRCSAVIKTIKVKFCSRTTCNLLICQILEKMERKCPS